MSARRFKVTHHKTGTVHYLTAEQLAKLPREQPDDDKGFYEGKVPVLSPTSARPLAPFPGRSRRHRGGAGSSDTGVIHLRDLKDRDWVRVGVKHEGKADVGHHADIKPKQYIRLFGTSKKWLPKEGRVEPSDVAYDITFRVGDQAVYGGYNLTYTGPILAIGAKTITVQAGMTGDRKKQLTIAQFSHDNRDYDAEKIAKRNAEWMD
jgi:hypothetical protein